MLRQMLFRAGIGLLLLVGKASGAALDGGWQLVIEGQQAFVFGEPGFGGGIRIPWRVVIEFEVQQGRYRIGSGSARWLGPPAPLSRPRGWFDCRQVEGSYLDSNLVMHETPRVRFARFPVAGQVIDGRVRLEPGYESPGNYLAVTYRCVTEHPGADNWFALAERGKQVLGKRQDSETRSEAGRHTARVREVAALPPEARLDLPLQDGWTFSQGTADGVSSASYELKRLE
jgi:hypothetical protein